jgi:hypothetical protein
MSKMSVMTMAMYQEAANCPKIWELPHIASARSDMKLVMY